MRVTVTVWIRLGILAPPDSGSEWLNVLLPYLPKLSFSSEGVLVDYLRY